LVGERNGLLKKLLQLVSSPGENVQFIVEDIAKLDGSEEFLRQWDLIYNVVDGALPQAGVALSQIVVSFYRGCLSLMKLPQTTEKINQGLRATAICVFLDLNSGAFQRKDIRLFKPTERGFPMQFFQKLSE
jgi:hypothetical protein